jgi:hypothetical protein
MSAIASQSRQESSCHLAEFLRVTQTPRHDGGLNAQSGCSIKAPVGSIQGGSSMDTISRFTTAAAALHRTPAFTFRIAAASLATAAVMTLGAPVHADTLPFRSTSNVSSWQVATNIGGIDGEFASFPVAGFVPAVAVAGRESEGIGWIANNSTGTNGCCVGNWTFFVFRQTFDLSGYDPATVVLSFNWAADDSGEGFADRGTWTPKLRLNGGPLINGTWPTGSTYELGTEMVLDRGFVSGLNTIDFLVEGNGITDGMALVGSLTAAVPEPSTTASLLAGLACVASFLRRRRR